ncbi:MULTISPECIES: hypothetical protein [Sphingomonas]|uniref:Lipoprotein n=1 Tax=Sphingomonas molluscorum TaxID=418184 RepID=A0ABU8Q8I6_9SPHN|nr:MULTISPECIES: hypothetical protein [unclassified Sphingomonas]MBM7407352.1 hypothetical protein [Sphingomonas sp. JUb134]RSV16727.1 hypothetical protein CA235_04630 [Sphingomonas sp. ABOLF]GLK19511.1 hypothetical protein GCM10017606_03370 [Microbacterium terregens]
MKRWAGLAVLGMGLGGCATGPSVGPGNLPPPPPSASYSAVGLERILGQPANALTKLFGKPDAELTEGAGRKMQFGSDICVLDAYLYAPKGGGTPVVTYVDARQRNGAPIDRASCVAALVRREGGR